MRNNKFVVGILVLGLAVGVVGMVGFAWIAPPPLSGSAGSTAIWTVQKFITVDVTSFDFGTIPAGLDEVTENDAVTLSVSSNVEWDLSFTKSGSGSNHLLVSLLNSEGEDDAEITVGYSLNDLCSMDAGDYSVTVTYTVTIQ